MEQSEKGLIGACGGYCGGCGLYLAYVNNDEEQKKKVAKQIYELYNQEVKPEDIKCSGCHGRILGPWGNPAMCFIRKCTEEKEIITCAFCDEFPCEKLEIHFEKANKVSDETKYGDVTKADLFRQKEIGLEKWLQEKKEKK